jgi:hypothetical protein
MTPFERKALHAHSDARHCRPGGTGRVLLRRPPVELEGAAGAAVFIWVWLVTSIVNGAIGVVHAGISVINEIGAFTPTSA